MLSKSDYNVANMVIESLNFITYVAILFVSVKNTSLFTFKKCFFCTIYRQKITISYEIFSTVSETLFFILTYFL